MSKLTLKALMTIETLAPKRMPHTQIARLLGVTEGTVRYRLKRMVPSVDDSRSRQEPRASMVAAVIEHWCSERGAPSRRRNCSASTSATRPSAPWTDRLLSNQ